MQAPLIAAGFTYAVPALGATIGTTGVTYATVLAHAVIIAATVGASIAMAPDAPTPEGQQKLGLKQTVPPRWMGFGCVPMVGSYVLYEKGNVSGLAFSIDVMAQCQGPLGGVRAIYLDDKAVDLGSAGTYGNTVGLPTIDWAYLGTRVAMRGGKKLETAFSIPGCSVWTADHRGDRVVQLQLMCPAVKQEDALKRYPHGHPQVKTILYLPCWDFRDEDQDPDDADTWIDYPAYDAGTTYAAGDRVLHGGLDVDGLDQPGGMLWLCLANATTGVEPGTNYQKWAAVWANPILQAVTYIIHPDGMGIPRTRLITPALPDLVIEANKCDVPILKADASYESRYTSHPFFRLDTEPDQVLGLIFASADIWAGLDGTGALKLKVGVAETPTITIGEDEIVGVEFSYAAPDEEKLDELTLSYTSPEHDWTTQSPEPYTNQSAIYNRGQVRTQAFGPSSVQSPTQLRRLAKPLMLRANAPSGVITCNMGGLVGAGERWVTIDYPLIPELDGQIVELRRRVDRFAGRQVVYEFVVADPATLYAWTTAEEGAGVPTPDVIDPEELPVPENLAGVVGDADTGYRVDLSWDDPERPDLDYAVRYRLVDDGAGNPGAWSDVHRFNEPDIAAGRVSVSFVLGTEIDTPLEVEAASIHGSGTFSDWSDALPIVVSSLTFLTDNAGNFIVDNDGRYVVAG